VTWEQLPDLLVKVPDRGETVLRISPQSDQVTLGRYCESVDRAGALVRQYGFRYLGDAGAPKARAAEVNADQAMVFISGDLKRAGAYPLQHNGRAVTARDLIVEAAVEVNPPDRKRIVARLIRGGDDGKSKPVIKQILVDALIHLAPGAADDIELRDRDILMIGNFGRPTSQPSIWQDVK
jgi:hypothetical protein